jgi:hypothetical protein
MATMTALTVNVTAPPVAPYSFGLFSVAPPGPQPDPHFGAVGLVAWESAWCGGAVGVTGSPCVQDNPAAIAVDNTVCNYSQFQPFWVYAYSQGSAGAWLGPELEAEARDRLVDGEQFAAEQQTYKGRGVLHMGRYAATLLSQQGLLMPDGNVLRSKLGTPVIAGGGYQQVGGALPATYDVFGTGPVVAMAGPATTIPAQIDRGVNDTHALAFKPYVVGWDCTAVGVTIT